MFICDFFLKSNITLENFMVIFSWFLRGQNSIFVLSQGEKETINLGETLRALIFPFKFLDSYITSLPIDLIDMVQNPCISFIGIPNST